MRWEFLQRMFIKNHGIKSTDLKTVENRKNHAGITQVMNDEGNQMLPKNLFCLIGRDS